MVWDTYQRLEQWLRPPVEPYLPPATLLLATNVHTMASPAAETSPPSKTSLPQCLLPHPAAGGGERQFVKALLADPVAPDLNAVTTGGGGGRQHAPPHGRAGRACAARVSPPPRTRARHPAPPHRSRRGAKGHRRILLLRRRGGLPPSPPSSSGPPTGGHVSQHRPKRKCHDHAHSENVASDKYGSTGGLCHCSNRR
ncbi:hypothetical protein OsJ_28865 [Oryza sativa Japonica Group]|uniref:Uncharacterized protein n=1 Tax=Oryza sativa subsp. japonica TaxID=39947 RepID=B9G2W4_ORYSJ|nr:hypothetical protein OsJ_28865 [Oryza sativa Japonica Group]